MPADGLATLAYAVRPRVVLKYFGQLSLSLAAMVAVPLVFALADGEQAFALRCAVVLAAILAAGIPLGRMAAPKGIQTNEALVIVALLFAAAALEMSWPLMAAGLSFVDAAFEAVSAITTTGLSTLATVDGVSATFLFTRAWMQWYGGLVIVVLALALVIQPGQMARRLSGAEGGEEDLVAGTRVRARRVLAVYAALTVAGVAALGLLGVPALDAVVHTLAAVSTGGFSSHDQSLAALAGWPARAAVTVISFAGAVSFMLYWRLWRRDLRAVWRDEELRALLVAALAVTLALVGSMALSGGGWSWGEALAHAPFLAVSAQTTTGFSTLAVGELDGASKLVLIVSMGIGGDVGSTAGGIKIVRLLLVLRLLQFIFLRASVSPHAVVDAETAWKRSSAEIQAMVTVVFLFLAVILVSWLLFLLAGHDGLDALFDVVSATATTGLSTGVTAPGLHPLLKGVLSLDMLMGRLEIVAVLLLFYPRTWAGRRPASK